MAKMPTIAAFARFESGQTPMGSRRRDLLRPQFLYAQRTEASELEVKAFNWPCGAPCQNPWTQCFNLCGVSALQLWPIFIPAWQQLLGRGSLHGVLIRCVFDPIAPEEIDRRNCQAYLDLKLASHEKLWALIASFTRPKITAWKIRSQGLDTGDRMRFGITFSEVKLYEAL